MSPSASLFKYPNRKRYLNANINNSDISIELIVSILSSYNFFHYMFIILCIEGEKKLLDYLFFQVLRLFYAFLHLFYLKPYENFIMRYLWLIGWGICWRTWSDRFQSRSLFLVYTRHLLIRSSEYFLNFILEETA